MNARPFMLGIVGDSASGRTTLTSGIVRVLGARGVTPICLDDYHRYERTERTQRGLTALDPACNDLELMTQHLATLRAGGTISKPIYDHNSGTLRGPELVAATDLVIAYGLLTLTTLELIRLFDLTVYLDPTDDLHWHWKLQRDVARRGYTPAQVHAQRPKRDRDAMRYLRPQRHLADLVIRFFAPENVAAHQIDPRQLGVQVTQRHKPGRPGLRAALEAIGADGVAAQTFLVLQQGIRDEDGVIADQLIYTPTNEQWYAHPYRDQLGHFLLSDTNYFSEALALAQLLVIYQLEQVQRQE